MLQSDGALAAQIRLEIGHQKGCSDSFPRDVANHQSKAFLTQIQKIVVIAADLASLKTDACVLECVTGRQCLREKPGLYHPCNLQFLGCADFGFQLLGDRAALRFQRPANVIETHQRKGVAVDILEAGEHAAPNRRLLDGRSVWMRLDPPQARRIAKMNSALGPLAVFCNDILCKKNDGRGPADEPVVFRAGIGRDQPEHRGSVGRSNRHQAMTGLKACIQGQIESELIHVELKTAILILDKDVDSVNPQVRVLAVQANGGVAHSNLSHTSSCSSAAHAGDYTRTGGSILLAMMAKWPVLGLLTAAVGLAQISFQPPLSSPALGGPVAIVTADFNGDGVPDLAVSDTASQVLAISLGNGDGTFKPAATYPVPSSCALASLFAGDFTGDQKLDLFGFCLVENHVLVFPGHGDGTFGTAISSQLPDLAFAGDIPILGLLAGLNGTVGDFNGDGKLDLVVVLLTDLTNFPPSPTYTYFVPGNGDGTFGTPVPIAQVNQALTVTSGDFNGDGTLDLAYLTAVGSGKLEIEDGSSFTITDQTLAISLGNGDGTFQAPSIYPWKGALVALSVADVNGDGFLDLYSAGASLAASGTGGSVVSVVTVMLGDGKGSFTPGFTAQDPIDNIPVSYCLADFTGTGVLDLEETFAAISGVGKKGNGIANTILGVRQGDGTGGFGSLQTFSGPSTIYPFASVCADFNGDGLIDAAYTGLPLDEVINSFKGEGAGSDVAAELDAGMADLPAGELYVSLNASPAPARTFSDTNSASFVSGPLAPNSIATAFWSGPAKVSGIGMTLQDSAGQTRAAQIFYASSTQINYLIPGATALGQATVTITGAPNPYSAPLKIVAVAPGVYNAGGLAVGNFDTVSASGTQTYTNLVTAGASGAVQPTPIDVTAGKVYLTLFGTGIRNHANAVTATIGSTILPTIYAGAQGQFVGEDQINIQLPASLAGAGLVKVTLNVDGQTSNPVQIQIK
jgi:uncharacterized protein (TIGR03437 family)